MKRSIFSLLAIGALINSPNIWANNVETELLQAFSRCDASMFTLLKQKQSDLEAYTPIEQMGKVARFRLNGSGGNGEVVFDKAMVVNGIRLTGFQSSVSELPLGESGNHPKFYFWGFTIAADEPVDVAASLPQLHLQDAGSVMAASPEIITDVRKSLLWQDNRLSTSGSMPTKNTVEKVLILEKQDSGKLSLTCTIQGYVPEALALRERPDLNR